MIFFQRHFIFTSRTGITSEHFYVNYVVSNYSDWVKIADSDGFPPTEDNFVLTWEERAFWKKKKNTDANAPAE